MEEIKMNGDELKFDYYKNQILITRATSDLKISLDYLPCYQGEKGDHGIIMSSCNGLLLCSNGFQGDRVVFYVCNPITKQWASIPPAPVACEFVHDFSHVGFLCDPNYDIDDQGGVILNPACSFRILRAFGSSYFDESKFNVDIFSSETGQWTTRTVTRLGAYWNMINYSPKRVITYKGKLHVQVGQSILMYDPYTYKLEADIDPPKENIFSGSPEPVVTCKYQADGSYKMHLDMNPPAEPNQVVAPMEGFSCCRGSLWTCQLHDKTGTLYLWRLEHGSNWSLVKKVSLKCTTELANKCKAYGKVLILHPDDPNMVYLSLSYQGLIVLWNLEIGTLEVVDQSANSDFYTWADAFLFEVPAIPYSIPEFPSHE